jgi:hypothetical protein
MKKPIIILARIVAAGALTVLAQNAQSQNITTGNLYQDSSASAYQYGNLNYGNGSAGNQIILSGTGPNDKITSFSFQFDYLNPSGGITGTPAGGETVDVTFYKNNGTPYNGYPTPGTVLWTSGTFSLGGGLGYTTGSLENFHQADINNGAGVIVPQDFTWVVTFSGLTGGETAGLTLYSPPTVGSDALPNGDGWVNFGSGWVAGNNSGNPLEFGAVFNGVAAPDSSCLSISVMAVLAGFGWMKRSQRRA